MTFYCHDKAATPNAGSITVRAVDGDTDELIPTATVKLNSQKGSANPVRFTGAAFGTYTVSASAPGYTPASESVSISAASPNKTVTLKLYRGSGEVTVIVRDSSDRTVISGATVSGAGYSDTTGSNGRVSFSGIPFGTTVFTAAKTGYRSGSASAAISQSSPSATVTIYLDPISSKGDITVTVKNRHTGNTISGATVTGDGRSKTTGSDGRTTFGDLAFGSYTFTAAKTGYRSDSGTETVTPDSPSGYVTVYLEPLPITGDITVTVRDRNTNALIPGAPVVSGSLSAVTNASGQAAFRDLTFGSYTFTASKNGYYSNDGTGSVSQTSPSAAVTIYLTPVPTTGSITVTVRDAEDDSVLPGAAVTSDSLRGTTNGSGQALFTDLPFKTYSFTASFPEYMPGTGSATIGETSGTASVTIRLEKVRTDLSVDAKLNGTLYKGSEIIVSAKVFNDGDIDLTPSRPATVTMTAKDADGAVFDTQEKPVIIPENGDNLVWYAVTVPDTERVTFDFHVTAPEGVPETNLRNNDDSLTAPVETLPERSCEDAGLETEAPEGFSAPETPADEADELTWTVWEWDDDFVRKTYRAMLVLEPELIPDETAGTRVETDGVWTTRSGYGADTSVTVSVVSNSDTVVGTVKADAFFPEYAYSEAAEKSDRLELVDGAYVFKVLPSSVSEARMHTVPLWFPDGTYAVKYYAFDVWCPAGMLTAQGHASVLIDGDMYDDLYTQ